MSLPRLLLIDDSNTECIFMGNALQKAGYEVHVAMDGENGLRMAFALHPQCLVLDVILPDINGYEICRRIRQADRQHSIAIILVSTKNTSLDRSYGLRMGADLYLPKPFAGEVLVKAIWDVLPAHLRPATVPLSAPEPKRVMLGDLLPRCRENSEMLASSNPFGHTWRLDRPSRRLLTLIDGRKTVNMLCKETTLSIQDLTKMLIPLFEQQLIEFYDQTGHICKESPFKFL